MAPITLPNKVITAGIKELATTSASQFAHPDNQNGLATWAKRIFPNDAEKAKSFASMVYEGQLPNGKFTRTDPVDLAKEYRSVIRREKQLLVVFPIVPLLHLVFARPRYKELKFLFNSAFSANSSLKTQEEVNKAISLAAKLDTSNVPKFFSAVKETKAFVMAKLGLETSDAWLSFLQISEKAKSYPALKLIGNLSFVAAALGFITGAVPAGALLLVTGAGLHFIGRMEHNEMQASLLRELN